MVRVLNVLCVALMAVVILGLYHVSEKTRVTRMELVRTGQQIAQARSAIGVLQAEWSRVAAPGRVQELAGARGMDDAVSAQLSAFDQLPARGDGVLNNDPVRDASAQIPTPPPPAAVPGF